MRRGPDLVKRATEILDISLDYNDMSKKNIFELKKIISKLHEITKSEGDDIVRKHVN